MTTNIKTVPAGYTTVTPWIISHSTQRQINFFTNVFGAKEVPNSRISNNEGLVIHAVIHLGDAVLMLFDAKPGWGPSPAFLNIYVQDIEEVYRKALEAGASSVTETTRLWFGEKTCRILDPQGNLIWINERVEEFDFTDAEKAKKRAATAEAIAGIDYMQKSLDEAMKRQRNLLGT